MYLPFDEKLKIHPQDDSFLNKKVWDFKNTPKENYPLLLHYHPLTLYRYQVCKQADTVLAHFLREEETTIDIIKNDFEYYEKITTHDSSLSTCIFSIMASRLGLKEKSYDYFINNARLDLDDLHHNTKNGIHTAAMGGSWMGVVFGFVGMRIKNGELHFNPLLPDKINKIKFKINFKHRELEITLDKEGLDIKLISGNSLDVYINNNKKTVE
jgi:alpha,alpha-trehalose phosphorylase